MSTNPEPQMPFQGKARLFPLPNLVLFPYVIQPLHIFEPRYRQLMEDSLADDRLMAMALLRPGWEEDYQQRPPIHPVVCLGKILKEERLADGRFNFLLQGLSRARVKREIVTPKLYRSAHLDLLHDQPVASPQAETDLRQRLRAQMGHWFATQPAALGELHKLWQSPLSLGTLCDVFSFALPLGLEVKRTLLEEVRVQERAAVLLGHLETTTPPAAASSSSRKFPPDFSSN